MTRHSYAREKLGTAVDILATGSGPLTKRIYDAYLSFHPLRPEDFERKEDANRYRDMMKKLTSVTDGDPENGYVKNTLAVMDIETAESIAEDIVALHHSVRR